MLGRACAMIFPIRWPEPFGLVMVEAMACGTPVVTTNWGAAPELVDDGVTGFRRDGDDDLVESRSARPATSSPADCRARVEELLLGRRRWCAATRRVYEQAIESPPLSPGDSSEPDFHYGRSVITMAAVAPLAASPPGRYAPRSRSTTSTSRSTTARSCAASRLAVEPGSLHALMGPNGSGKSTLANTLLANPAYEVTGGRILLDGRGRHRTCPTDERARRGLFLGFQHPEEIPGVSVLNFLRQAIATRKGIDDFSVLEVRMQPARLDEAAGHGHPLPGALPQRGLLRRREEAQRDPADGDAGTRRRGARRDRLRPRHRRAAPGRGRHRGGAQRRARTSASSRSRTTSASSSTSSPTSCTCSSTAASSRPAAPSSRSRSRPRASTRSAPKPHEEAAA